MAELLIVVGILIVLFALSFIAVQNYQKSLAQTEYDTIAKELFIAAQNHITTAESQGYLGIPSTDYGTIDKTATSNDVYYYLVEDGTPDLSNTEIFDLMLPFGSIDETVRMGGSYVIRYQPSSATILDVFYSNNSPGERYGTSISGLLDGDGGISGLLQNYRESRKSQAKVVGWYGKVAELPIGSKLSIPTVTIHNEEKLWVEVTHTKTYTETENLILIVTGKTSGAQCKFTLGSASERVVGDVFNKVILDDITTSRMRFGALAGQNNKNFIPGEDLFIEAVAFDNTQLTNVAYSGKQSTNSLFNGIYDSGTYSVAVIANCRHLENIEQTISGFNGSVTHFEQVADLNWWGTAEDAFSSRIRNMPPSGVPATVPAINQIQVFRYSNSSPSATATGAGIGLYVPVNASANLEYKGNKHVIKNVSTNVDTGGAGLFGSLNNADISDLKLIDFNIRTQSGNAGALAGTVTNSATVTNVIAYNTSAFDIGADGKPKTTIFAAGTGNNAGNAGGLIGYASGVAMEKSAAALVVNGGTNAGGLIGRVSAGNVSACYSGGHTVDMRKTDASGNVVDVIGAVYSGDPWNVTAGNNAGGLIGDAGSASITSCYSTCSVRGTAAGGFIGSAKGTITNCYCVGRVTGTTTAGAFAGVNKDTGFTLNECKYFEIMNEIQDEEWPYMPPYPGYEKVTHTGISAFDDLLENYQSFIGEKGVWTSAEPYHEFLSSTFNNKFSMRSVSRLLALTTSNISVAADDFVSVHHGDWPVPETLVINAG